MARRTARGAWVVTGAASGFGRAMAIRLGARGERVALWDRDVVGLRATASRLPEDASIEVEVDVTDPDALVAAADRTARELGSIAHVFHCAGVLAVGPMREMPPAEYRRMIEINYLGSVYVAQAVLPHLEHASRDGQATLAFVASVAGLRGFPQLAGYCASKFAVVGFAQALADELAGGAIDVKVLCPPAADTPMVRNLPKVPPIYKLSPLISAEQVVDAAIEALDRPGLVALLDLRSKALWRVARFAPAVVDRIVRAVR